MFVNTSMKWNSNNTTTTWIYEVCWLLRITWKCCCESNLSKWTMMKSWQFILWLLSWMINVSTELSSQNYWFKILECIRVLGGYYGYDFSTLRLQCRSKMVVYTCFVWKGNIYIKLCTTSVWKDRICIKLCVCLLLLLKLPLRSSVTRACVLSYSFGIYVFFRRSSVRILCCTHLALFLMQL